MGYREQRKARHDALPREPAAVEVSGRKSRKNRVRGVPRVTKGSGKQLPAVKVNNPGSSSVSVSRESPPTSQNGGGSRNASSEAGVSDRNERLKTTAQLVQDLKSLPAETLNLVLKGIFTE